MLNFVLNFNFNSMRLFTLLLLLSLTACSSERFLVSTLQQRDYGCENITLSGDSVICVGASGKFVFPLDSLAQVQRSARPAGAVILGGLGAAGGFFIGTLFGALWAWSANSKTPEAYLLIPAIGGGILGFLAGNSLWTMIDQHTLYLLNFPRDRRAQHLETFIK
jgi:hypothetical protein